jgi:hypothetical protein
MSKVYITSEDPVTYRVYDEKEANELFGEGFMNEYGTEIPDNLLKRYKAVHYEFWEIQNEIAAWRK